MSGKLTNWVREFRKMLRSVSFFCVTKAGLIKVQGGSGLQGAC